MLLIAKPDRLACNIAFIANLLEGGMDVAATDMPEANRFMPHIMTAGAKQERHAISERTKAARKGAAVNKAQALANAEKCVAYDQADQRGGASLHQIAAELNARGIKTARGGKWYATAVLNIVTAKNGAEAVAA